MDCAEEEDASSLLSLSQTLLQQDSSASGMGLSTTQFQNWPTSSVSTADIAGHFSPVSPVDAYGSTSITGHTLTDNDNNLRLYGFRSVNNQVATRDSGIGTFRGGNTSESTAVVQTNFSSSNRVSSTSNALNSFEYNHSPGHVNTNNSSSLYYEHNANLRSNNEVYGNKDTSISSMSGINENYVSHHANSPAVTSYNQTSSYTDTQNMMGMNLNTTPEICGKTVNENLHLDQSLFDSRIKTQDYTKDLNSIYDQSASKIAPKILQSHDISVSFDRRNQDGNNLDSNFEFQSSSREFTSSTRIDMNSMSRRNQHSDYHQPQSANENMSHVALSQKYSTSHGRESDSQFLNTSFSLEPNSKRTPSTYLGFGIGGHGDDVYGSANDSKKMSTSYQFNELPSDLEPVFHGSHQDFSGHQKTPLDIQKNFGTAEFRDIEECSRMGAKGQTNARDISSKWSGRPRAHRKMARLLASEDHRQRNENSQTIDTNNSMKMSFTKTIPGTQGKIGYQKDTRQDFCGNTKNFLSVEEEMDLRTNQQVQQKSFGSRRDENLERHSSTHRDLGLMQHTGTAFSFDTSNISVSMPKDNMNNILNGSHFLSTSNLELDFHPSLSVSQSQRDLDLNQHFVLQVPKDFDMETTHNVGNQSDLSFEHTTDGQHINQSELSLPDNLGLGSHTQQDLNLEAYFNPSAERDIAFGRKFSSQVARDMSYAPSASENDFNIEDYMNPQTQRDMSQPYFERADLPQDMRLYQKTAIEKTATIHETSNLSKGREKDQASGEKVGEISELQKELTKTSTKESMKGIRIPRDINRAMEILQGLQEDEKEEARRQQQQRQQQHQSSGLLSSPKKNFQNKHQVESIAVSEQQFLGPSGSFIEDQSVGNILDQSHINVSDHPQDSFQIMPPYQPFNHINQPADVDIASALHSKRDLQHNMTPDLDYHILKRLALSTSVKEPPLSQSPSFSNQTPNIASILSANSSQEHEVQFPITGISTFQNQQPEIYDVLPNKSLPHSNHSTLEGAGSKNDIQLTNFEPRQTSNSNKPQTFQAPTETQPVIDAKEAEILLSSRKSLYSMMQQEQFCDAILSISKQIVKVHKVVLCSMSQYLSTLLHTMEPAMPSNTSTASQSSAPSFTPQNSWNHQVLLVVNSDGIKTSSMSAFLLYIYMGKTEFSENNITDLYMLACSLRVQSLKDLCKEFMSKTQISEDQIKIPQLLVSNQRMEMGDQASTEDLGSKKSYEDKSINTAFSCKTMEVATQTDRSTSEAGEGGQEEWVMLKKTKQKTVSPSKSRLTTKPFSGTESPIGFKTGKKGWLSPKRRFMQKDHGNACKDPVHNFSNVSLKEASEKLPLILEPDHIQKISKQPHVNISKAIATTFHDGMNKDPHLTKHSLNNPSTCVTSAAHTTSSKSTRTTVEIAAAAAAAKLSAHSYGTRAARGVTKNQVSYAALASGQDKKKSTLSVKERVISAVSKKKDFIKSNPPSEFSTEPKPYSEPDEFTPSLKGSSDTTHDNTCINNNSVPDNTSAGSMSQTGSRPATETFKTMVKRPFKKSIVHRSRSEELLRNAKEGNSISSLNTNTDDVADISTQGSSKTDSSLNVNELTDNSVSNVSTLIDSIVNTMDSENEDLDLQKVIHDLDNVLNKSPLLTATSASSVSSSFISPLKSPPSSTSESPSPLKSKTTPQGFRKRLIHLMNSEKSIALASQPQVTSESLIVTSSRSQDGTTVTQSLANTPITTVISQPVPVVTSSTTDNHNAVTSVVKTVPEGKESLPIYLNEMPTKPVLELPVTADTQNKTTLSEDTGKKKSSVLFTEKSLDFTVDAPVSSFSSMTDLELGLKDEDGNNFHHKIFKRKKKSKARKTTETENTSIKMKLKKLQTNDSEGHGSKSRQRKTTGSDTEGVGTRPKQKKILANELEGVVAKVRPPPKKRAKMELELLKAARSEGSEREMGSDRLLSKTEDADLKAQGSNKRENAAEMDSVNNDSQSFSTLLNAVEAEKASSTEKQKKSESKAKNKNKSKESKKSQKSNNVLPDPSQIPEGEITMETKLTLMLEELAKGQNLKSRLFTCNLCETQVRSARRTIKHMKSHGLDGEEALDKISIGEKGTGQKACEICGYETKDQTYYYMHYHKYFKHGVPLPLGWSTDKCEICGKECFTKFQLKEHMLSHDENFCFVCWQCGQSFKNRNGFNSHMFHRHSDVRKHDCKVCGRAFKTWTQLKVHVRSHTGERPFSCLDCGHQSSTQGNMKIHLNTHGYTKDKIIELMEKISKNVPEEDPQSLEKTMLSIAEKLKADPNMPLKSPAKRKKKSNTNKDTPSDNSTDPASVKKKKPDSKSKETKTTHVSKFTGSHIKRLLTEPLAKLKPPKFLLPALSKQPSTESGSSSTLNVDSVNSQVLHTSDSDLGSTVDANNLSLLLQQQLQKQEKSGSQASATTYLISVPPIDQASLLSAVQQQQHSQQQALESLASSLMGYIVIPSHPLTSQPGQETSVDNSSASMSLPILSTPDIMPSGLASLQAGVQLLQTDGVFHNSAGASGLQTTQDAVVVQDPASFLGSTQGGEIFQSNSTGTFQYPSTNILVSDSNHHNVTTGTFQTVLASSDTTDGNTTVMVLPNVVGAAPQVSQSLNQQASTIFSYPDLMTNAQSMLLPVTPGEHIIRSALDSGNFVNFPVTATAPEELMTMSVQGPHFEDVTVESEKCMTDETEIDLAVSINASVDEGNEKVKLENNTGTGNFNEEDKGKKKNERDS